MRVFDFLMASLLLIILLPLLIMISIAIAFDSSGEIIFKQKRTGKDKRLFVIYKFRTMLSTNTLQKNLCNEQIVSSGTDSRITRMGRILRSTSLDELPQLWSILKGDMSFIGPRPVIPEQLKAIPPGYMKRFKVRPGLTGLAQVNGRRSLSWLRQLAYDKEYVENKSLRLDVRILFKTIKVVLLGSGVYGGEGENWRTYLNNLEGRPPADSDVEHFLQHNNKRGSLK